MTALTANASFATGPLREYLFPLVVILGSLTLPFHYIIWAFLVVGHAHFLMAYVYQYRGKRMNMRYGLLAVALCILALWYFFIADIGYLPILVASGMLFALHFAIDEFTLHGEKLGTEGWIATIGFTVLFSSLMTLVALPTVAWLSWVAVGAGVLTVLARVLVSRAKISNTEQYLFVIGGLLWFLGAVMQMPSHILGVILLLHFGNWYVGYGVRLRSRPERAKAYLNEVVITLCISLAFFIVYMLSEGALFYVFFGLTPYYAWAIAHILLSFVTAVPQGASAR